MTRALLFDLDGTLTDSREGITRCVRHALETLGAAIPAEADLLRWIGPPLHASFADYFGAARNHLVPHAVAAYRERFASVGLFENAVYPGVAAALEHLQQQGWKLYLATSKPQVFAERILHHFDLHRYFTGVHGSELSGERSDKAELIAHVLRTEALVPEHTTMIGDRFHDVLGARKNGVRALGVLWGYGSAAELREAGAHAAFSSVEELLAALAT